MSLAAKGDDGRFAVGIEQRQHSQLSGFFRSVNLSVCALELSITRTQRGNQSRQRP
jgi:hypothetical protein